MHLEYKYSNISRQALALEHDYCQSGAAEDEHCVVNCDKLASLALSSSANNSDPLDSAADQTEPPASSNILIDFVSHLDHEGIENQIKAQ